MIAYTNTPKSLIEASFLSSNEFRLLAVLNTYAFMNRIFPSQEELGEKCRLSRRAVIDCLNNLRDNIGCIVSMPRSSESGRFSTNQYAFVQGSWNKWYSSRYKELAADLQGYKTEAVSKDALMSVDGIVVRENKLPYVRIWNAFLYSDKINANELRVFLYLKGYANCDHIYPKYESMMNAMGLSKNTIIKSIKDLGDKGLVQKIIQMRPEGGNTSNEYLILNDDELTDWLGLSED